MKTIKQLIDERLDNKITNQEFEDNVKLCMETNVNDFKEHIEYMKCLKKNHLCCLYTKDSTCGIFHEIELIFKVLKQRLYAKVETEEEKRICEKYLGKKDE